MTPSSVTELQAQLERVSAERDTLKIALAESHSLLTSVIRRIASLEDWADDVENHFIDVRNTLQDKDAGRG